MKVNEHIGPSHQSKKGLPHTSFAARVNPLWQDHSGLRNFIAAAVDADMVWAAELACNCVE